MRFRSILFTVAAIAAFGSGFGIGMNARAEGLLYSLSHVTHLPGTGSDWDYAKMEPGSNRLFIARDQDGLTVFDVDSRKVIGTVENSVGANGPLLLPEVNRGYVAMTDGSLLIFDLQSLKAIDRIKLNNEGGLNSAAFDPATGLVHVITGSREKTATWYSFDAKSGKQAGSKVFPFRKMDDPASDGKGRLFAPARYDDIILILDAKTLAEKARWPVGCHVSKVRYQAKTNRLLAACTGDKPSFFALDATTGREIARLPIGHGIDGLAIDEKNHRIISSNGTDGTLTVIEQKGADSYRLLGTISTRIGARMMDIDKRTGRLLVVNADYTQGPADATGAMPDKVFHPDSFVVLTYQPD